MNSASAPAGFLRASRHKNTTWEASRKSLGRARRSGRPRKKRSRAAAASGAPESRVSQIGKNGAGQGGVDAGGKVFQHRAGNRPGRPVVALCHGDPQAKQLCPGSLYTRLFKRSADRGEQIPIQRPRKHPEYAFRHIGISSRDEQEPFALGGERSSLQFGKRAVGRGGAQRAFRYLQPILDRAGSENRGQSQAPPGFRRFLRGKPEEGARLVYPSRFLEMGGEQPGGARRRLQDTGIPGDFFKPGKISFESESAIESKDFPTPSERRRRAGNRERQER